jgi:hypothetical protein
MCAHVYGGRHVEMIFFLFFFIFFVSFLCIFTIDPFIIFPKMKFFFHPEKQNVLFFIAGRLISSHHRPMDPHTGSVVKKKVEITKTCKLLSISNDTVELLHIFIFIYWPWCSPKYINSILCVSCRGTVRVLRLHRQTQ